MKVYGNHIILFPNPKDAPGIEEFMVKYNGKISHFNGDTFWFDELEDATMFKLEFGGEYFDKSIPRRNGKPIQ